MALSDKDREILTAIIKEIPSQDPTITYAQMIDTVKSDAPPAEKIEIVTKALGRPLTPEEKTVLDVVLVMSHADRTTEAALLIGLLINQHSGNIIGELIDQIVKIITFLFTPSKW